ncbi:MAG: hypothetical protein WBZ24_13640, partial [Anaerolineales bacterium]
MTDTSRPKTSPSHLWIALATLVLIGLAGAQVSFETLRGTGILRQPAFLTGLGLVGLVGLALMVWFVRRRVWVEAALESMAQSLPGWVERRRNLAAAVWILCLLVLPAWIASGALEPA